MLLQLRGCLFGLLSSLLLFCSLPVSATPARPKSTATKTTLKAITVATPMPAAAALHGCGVVVQRWCLECYESFDTYYYSNGVNFFTQTTIGHTPGAELVPYQVGSNILHITNVADPIRDPVDSSGHDSGAHDPGKLSFVWGSQSWNTYSAGSPCSVNAYPYINYTCTFQCDR